jgi:hypothetical protein
MFGRAPILSIWRDHIQARQYAANNPDSMLGQYIGAPRGGMDISNPTMASANSRQIPSFEAGGMMSAGGAAVRPGMGMQPSIPSDVPLMGASAPPSVDSATIDAEAKKFVQSNPQAVQQIQAVIANAMQTGELTTEELSMMVNLAKTALANPTSYPQIRAFAIKNGLGTEADIPQELDKGLLFTLLIAGQSMQVGAPKTMPVAGDAVQGQKPAGVIPSYEEGGMTGDKPHLAKVHPREYIVPEDALIYHGKKHFDKLVEQARTPPDAKQSS